jgi:hypothetical protein
LPRNIATNSTVDRHGLLKMRAPATTRRPSDHAGRRLSAGVTCNRRRGRERPARRVHLPAASQGPQRLPPPCSLGARRLRRPSSSGCPRRVGDRRLVASAAARARRLRRPWDTSRSRTLDPETTALAMAEPVAVTAVLPRPPSLPPPPPQAVSTRALGQTVGSGVGQPRDAPCPRTHSIRSSSTTGRRPGSIRIVTSTARRCSLRARHCSGLRRALGPDRRRLPSAPEPAADDNDCALHDPTTLRSSEQVHVHGFRRVNAGHGRARAHRLARRRLWRSCERVTVMQSRTRPVRSRLIPASCWDGPLLPELEGTDTRLSAGRGTPRRPASRPRWGPRSRCRCSRRPRRWRSWC